MKSTISLEKETIGKLAIRGKKGDTFEQIISDLLRKIGGQLWMRHLEIPKNPSICQLLFEDKMDWIAINAMSYLQMVTMCLNI